MQFDATPQTAIVVHVFHQDVWKTVIAPRLKALRTPFDLYITLNEEVMQAVEETLRVEFPKAELHCFPNHGMDILPFLQLITLLKERGYRQVLKLHTKKGTTDFGHVWGRALVESLLPSPDALVQAEQTFSENDDVVLCGPAHFFLSGQQLLLDNKPHLAKISQDIVKQSWSDEDWGFFAGSMFWSRPHLWQELADWAKAQEAFVKNGYAQDGQLAHAIERAFGLIAHRDGHSVALTYPPGKGQEPITRLINDQEDEINRVGTRALADQLRTIDHDVALFESAGLLDLAGYRKYLGKKFWQTNDLDKVDLVRHYLMIGQFSRAVHFSKAWDLHKQNKKIDWAAEAKKSREADLTSIVMPVFNQLNLTRQAVNAVIHNTPQGSYELILVDNGSDDETYQGLKELADKYSQIKLVRLPENKNFALGSNLGFVEGKGQYTIFLNNDTEVQENWLQPLISAIEQSSAYAVQPLLLYPDGDIQCMGIVFSSKSNLGYSIYQGMTENDVNITIRRSFQAVTAACMALRASDFAKNGGFDPIYINGQEDIDMCLRLKEATKAKAAYVPNSRVIHHESKSEGRGKYIEQNREIFIKRWSRTIKPDDLMHYRIDGFFIASWLDNDLSKPDRIRSVKPELKKIAAISMPENLTRLRKANSLFREKNYTLSALEYSKMISDSHCLSEFLAFNLRLAKCRDIKEC